MMQKDKQLLLQDLCTRLLYEVKCKVNYIINNETTYGEDVESECIDIIKRISFDTYSVYTEWLGYESDIEDIKPYLRPMSSMTEEGREELRQEQIKDEQLFADCIKNHPEMRGLIIPHFAADWCDKNMFDYRGLIEKGLAIEAPEGMYN